MKNLRIFLILSFLLGAGLYKAGSQQVPVEKTGSQLEQQYEDFINRALSLQVRADSLSRTANQKRREFAFTGDASARSEAEGDILSLERESLRVQKQADSLYSQARAIELRLMAGLGKNDDIDDRPVSDKTTPAFLVLGGTNISSFLSPGELLKSNELKEDYLEARRLMGEVSDINDEIDLLNRQLESNPRRRERRNINRRLDELSELSFEKKMAAMDTYEKVHELRYKAAVGYIGSKREEADEQHVMEAAMVHEEIAAESFRQARGLRETAVDLRSDRYLQDFIFSAYTEEVKAFSELERALEIYDNPSLIVKKEEPSVPLDADGRIDTGLALSRSRPSAGVTDPARQPRTVVAEPPVSGMEIDFGFSVLPGTPYSEHNPLPANVLLPDGIVYRIQLGVFNVLMNPESFGGLSPVMMETDNGRGTISYYAGVFSTYQESENAITQVNRHGFSDAFIVAYSNGTRIPLERARQMERNRQGEVQRAETRPDTTGREEMVPAIRRETVQDDSGGVNFRIQLGAFRSPLQSAVFRRWQALAGEKNIEHTINNNGLYVYSIGNFNTFEEAVQMRDIFRDHGVSDAFIAPYKGQLRISIDEINR